MNYGSIPLDGGSALPDTFAKPSWRYLPATPTSSAHDGGSALIEYTIDTRRPLSSTLHKDASRYNTTTTSSQLSKLGYTAMYGSNHSDHNSHRPPPVPTTTPATSAPEDSPQTLLDPPPPVDLRAQDTTWAIRTNHGHHL